MLLQGQCLRHCKVCFVQSKQRTVKRLNKELRSTSSSRHCKSESCRLRALDGSQGGDIPHEDAIALQLVEVLQGQQAGAYRNDAAASFPSWQNMQHLSAQVDTVLSVWRCWLQLLTTQSLINRPTARYVRGAYTVHLCPEE